MHGIDAALQRRMVEFSDELDREGVSPMDQIAVFGGMLALTLATMPPADARAALMAHIEACRETLADPGVAAAGAIIRTRRGQQ